MDKEMLEYHLRKSERRVAEGYASLTRQREVLADLTRAGQTEAAKRASKLLGQAEDMQVSKIADCGRINEELAALRRRERLS
jgi:hypothetical protein